MTTEGPARGMRKPFELYALRYARHGGRKPNDNFIGGDLHEAGSDLAYFVWVAKRSDRLYVIDTGFGAEAAAPAGASGTRARPTCWRSSASRRPTCRR